MANEKRLIDANELLRNVDRYFFWSADEVRRFIATADTVDAVEVVHGKAVPIYSDIDYEDTLIRMDRQCNKCGALITQMDNYCPNCGARMDGDSQ